MQRYKQFQVWNVFRDTCRFWRVLSKNPTKLKRSGSDKEPDSPDCNRMACSNAVSPSNLIPCSCRSTGVLGEFKAENPKNFKKQSFTLGRRWTEVEFEEEDEDSEFKESSSLGDTQPFRARASTDGHLQHKTWKWR